MKKLGFVIMLLGGCTALNPGGQVREGLRQTKTYQWDEQGRFSVTGQGSQTERFKMMQGAIVLNEDGTPDLNRSAIEYYLEADPSAESAASVMGPAFEASTAQVKVLAETLGDLMKLLIPAATLEIDSGTEVEP